MRAEGKQKKNVCAPVGVVFGEQVLLGDAPQAKHVVQDLAPQHHRLQSVVELGLVVVRDPSAALSRLYRQREAFIVSAGIRCKVWR